jgi:hypothetical protein
MNIVTIIIIIITDYPLGMFRLQVLKMFHPFAGLMLCGKASAPSFSSLVISAVSNIRIHMNIGMLSRSSF